MTPFILHRDAAMLEADMLDVAEYCFDDKYKPSLVIFAKRVGELSDRIQAFEQTTLDQVKNAARWELLFNTEGVSYKVGDRRDINGNLVGTQVTIYREIANGSKLIGIGKTFEDATNQALGFK